MQEMAMIKFFRDFDHSKGEVNFLRSGKGGGGEVAWGLIHGCGRVVSKVR